MKSARFFPYRTYTSVVNRHRVDADPDPNFHVDADPDLDWHQHDAYPTPCFTLAEHNFKLLRRIPIITILFLNM